MLSTLVQNNRIATRVLKYIMGVIPEMLKSTAFVNKALNWAQNLFEVRNINFTFVTWFGNEDEEDTNEKIIRSTMQIVKYMGDDQVRQSTRRICVKGGNQASNSEVEHLAKLICHLNNLKLVCWNAKMQIPRSILDAIHRHSAAKLHIHHWTRTSNMLGPDDRMETELAQSPALTRLDVSFTPLYPGSAPDTRPGALLKIIANAPNLARANLFTGENFDWMNYMPRESTQQRIKEQHEANLAFWTDKKSSSIRSLALQGDLDVLLDTYLKAVQCDLITDIEFYQCRAETPAFFEVAGKLLPNIRELTLNLPTRTKKPLDPELQTEIDKAMSKYLTTDSPRLKLLSLYTRPDSVPLRDLLTHHGPSLTSLELHHRTRTRGPPVQSLSIEDIQLIRKSCPKLKTLAFDLQRRSASLIEDLEHYIPFLQQVSTLKLDELRISIDFGFELLHYPEWRYHTLVGKTSFKIKYLPPSYACAWPTYSNSDHPETESTKIEPFVSGIWQIVFGKQNGRAKRELRVIFEEWNCSWRISRGRRINVKEESLARSEWVATGGKDGEVSAKNVSTRYAVGIEGRVNPGLEFWGWR